MTDQELTAKAVFGEITLGDVVSRFNHRISVVNIAVLRNAHPVGYDYQSWWVEKGRLVLAGGDDVHRRRISFPLDAKVKIQNECLEIKEGDYNYRLIFLETKKITFDEILPGAAA